MTVSQDTLRQQWRESKRRTRQSDTRRKKNLKGMSADELKAHHCQIRRKSYHKCKDNNKDAASNSKKRTANDESANKKRRKMKIRLQHEFAKDSPTDIIMLMRDGSRRFVGQVRGRGGITTQFVSPLSREQLTSVEDMAISLTDIDDVCKGTALDPDEGLSLEQVSPMATVGTSSHYTLQVPLLGASSATAQHLGNCHKCYKVGIFPFACNACNRPFSILCNAVVEVLNPFLVAQLYGNFKGNGAITVGKPIRQALLQDVDILGGNRTYQDWSSLVTHEIKEEAHLERTIKNTNGTSNVEATELLKELKMRIHNGQWQDIKGKLKSLLYMLYERGNILERNAIANRTAWDVVTAGLVEASNCIVAMDRKRKCVYQV